MHLMLRALRRLGLIGDSIDKDHADMEHVRSDALDVNQQARQAIYDSRSRRNLLQLEYELARRHSRHRKP